MSGPEGFKSQEEYDEESRSLLHQMADAQSGDASRGTQESTRDRATGTQGISRQEPSLRTESLDDEYEPTLKQSVAAINAIRGELERNPRFKAAFEEFYVPEIDFNGFLLTKTREPSKILAFNYARNSGFSLKKDVSQK